MTPRLRRGILLLGLLLVPSILHPSQIRSINLEEMTARADRIFMGRCVNVRVGVDTRLGQTVTWVTFAPERAIKGDIHGAFTIKLLGNQDGAAHPGQSVTVLPRFRKGERVVLFLHPDAATGLTSPAGFGQGTFRIREGKSGEDVAVNAFNNERLLDGLSVRAQQRIGARVKQLRGRRDIRPETLLELAASLRDHP